MDNNREDLKKINEGDEYYAEIKELTQNMEKSEFYPVFTDKSWICTCGCENSAESEKCSECYAEADKLRLVFSELFLMQKRSENAARKIVADRIKMEEDAERWRRIDPEVENIYQSAIADKETKSEYLEAAEKLDSIKGYKDADTLAKEYRELAEEAPELHRAEIKERRAKKVNKIAKIALVALGALLVLYAILYFTVIAPRGMRYKINNGEVTVTSYDTFFGGKHAEIPEKLMGKPVTAIGDRAFADSPALLSVSIPNTVRSVGASAFESCTSLKSVILPESVTYIGTSAFSNCKKLQSVEICGNVSEIKMSTFFDCEKLAEVIFHYSPSRVESIAFKGCSRLRDIRYTGSEDTWCVEIGDSSNDELADAVISYNYKK